LLSWASLSGQTSQLKPEPNFWFRLFSCALPDESQEDRQTSMQYGFRRIWGSGFGFAGLESV
jgi:hypothetical protein